MKELIIKLSVADDISAYKAVSKLSFDFEVLEAKYKQKVWKFNKTKPKKSPKKFLSDDFENIV